MGASPLGTTTGITESDAADVLAWRAAALAGENVVLVGTGNVDHDSLVAAAEALAPVVSKKIFETPKNYSLSLFTLMLNS